MSGETSLGTLLSTMSPLLVDERYVFCCVGFGEVDELRHVTPLATFREQEGMTLVLKKSEADADGIAYSGVFNCITLQVHSSLQAVGLTAAVSAALTDVNISANVIAAYHHDHVFVPVEDSEQALQALEKLSAGFQA